ncbi:NADP-dependent isocitrate dehydrogenase [Trueperella sp. LYQ143]|uniref:NADP-dependent isocitrate dehydrogenase n=1 Tax=unclassified Trueperella TaxID=2630174 RepID=UPI003983D678
MARIIYTHTDEAPMLATASLLPIIDGFAALANIDVEIRDISLSGRIIAAFSDRLPPELAQPDALAELGEMTASPLANIIKLPNISASVPQLKRAIAELQEHGYPLPDYPEDPSTDEEREIRRRYDAVKGSAVNPVLREGNSDRRAPIAVKNYARKNPHRMGAWSPESRTRVATMTSGDFRSSETSIICDTDDTLRIVFVGADGEKLLRDGIPVGRGDVVDSATMNVVALDEFLAEQVRAAREENLLLSVHLKATMMKVSDPVIFGHAVRAYFASTFATYGERIAALGLSANDGLGSILSGLTATEGNEDILESFHNELARGPQLSMVNSDRGITNLHVPSDVIVDASMPAMIKNGGHVWGPDGQPGDTIAVIPDSSYAGVYQVVIADCQRHGAFDPTTMGTVPNVGLMAQKAEEYGSHDKTFIAESAGRIEVRSSDGSVLLYQDVAAGDIYRTCIAKIDPIRDWVSLAVRRARISETPAIFWLDPLREHDQRIREHVERFLADEDTDGLEISIMSPEEATQATVDRVRRGENTISVTGNVLRDYLTDLFPIMELGTSAKMLSVVPLMAGGGLFETGAGGSAPKHVEQLITENHLRWDSLGEFLALAESLRHLARTCNQPDAQVLADALDRATERVLNDGRSPQRRTGEPDTRSSHAWLAIYWADELAKQTDNHALGAMFSLISSELNSKAETINAELLAAQGKHSGITGYYHPDPQELARAMRPSATLNTIIDRMRACRRGKA